MVSGTLSVHNLNGHTIGIQGTRHTVWEIRSRESPVPIAYTGEWVHYPSRHEMGSHDNLLTLPRCNRFDGFCPLATRSEEGALADVASYTG